MPVMDDILAYLQGQLKHAGPRRWAAISAATEVKVSLMRKLAYGDRDNPGVVKVQPLLTYFRQVERGELALPEPAQNDPTSESQQVAA